jgi:hypothetical protein
VLLCYALGTGPILDLPHKGVVRQYLDRGFEVYLIDRACRRRPIALTLEHYIRGFLARAVGIRRKHDRRLHLSATAWGDDGAAHGALERLLATLTLLCRSISAATRGC